VATHHSSVVATRLDERQKACQRAAVARARGVEELEGFARPGHLAIVAQTASSIAQALWHPYAVANVLAHQGGWDEILLVLAPVLVFAGLLRVASRRADRYASEQQSERDPHADAEHASERSDLPTE
jgi:hypothetical protein